MNAFEERFQQELDARFKAAFADQHVLVTGGGGFLGKAMVQALLDAGAKVRTFARGAYPELTEMGAEHVRGDLADESSVFNAVDGVDIVFHVAGLVKPFGNPDEFDAINIMGTQHVIDACVAHNVSRLVFTSTPSVVHDGTDSRGIDENKPYPETFLCDYFRSKAAAEQLLLGADETPLSSGEGQLRTCSIRPHGIYGPGDTSLFPLLIQRAKKGKLRIIGAGDTEVDWTYVGNAVYAHLLAAQALLVDDAGKCPAGGRAYFIADDCPSNPWTFFNGVLKQLGLGEVHRKVPLGVAKAGGAVMEGVWRTFGLKGEPPGTRAMASVLGNSSWYDLKRAREELKYEPLVTTDVGVELTLPYLKEQLDAGAFD